MAKAIEDEEQTEEDNRQLLAMERRANDREQHEAEISNIVTICNQLLSFNELNEVEQRSVADIRSKL